MLYPIVALFGLVFGSFLNVCIFRLTAEEEESIVFPRSHCRTCRRPIRWYDNIPVLSYLLLRGQCRDCRASISRLYPTVEILTAAIWVSCWAIYGPTPELAKYSLLGMLLIILIFTDIIARVIPHPVTRFGILMGLLLSFVVPVDDRPLEWFLRSFGISVQGIPSSVLGAVAGALFGGGFFQATRVGFRLIVRKFKLDLPEEGLGFGDVMLMIMVGVFLGVPLTFLTMLMAALLGSIIAGSLHVISSRFRGHYEWPFGVFLGASGICATLSGQALVEAYLRWSGLGN